MESGIYTITSSIDNKVYVGYSIDWKNRILHHKKNLRGNKHPNIHLQRAWNLYGEENFGFELLVECEEEYLASEENYWCNLLNVHNDKYGYNIQPTNPDNRVVHSEETKRLIGSYHKGKVISKEQREKLRITHNRPEVKEAVARGVIKRTGIKQTIEHITKRVSYHIEAKRTKLACENIRASLFNVRKEVLQYDLDKNFIREWNSLTSIGEALGYDLSAISRCCRGKQYTSYGYIWKFKKK